MPLPCKSLPLYDDEEDDAVTSLRDDLQALVQSYTERLDNEDWDTILNAKALLGTDADIDAIIVAAAEAEQSLDLGEALRWAAEPGSCG